MQVVKRNGEIVAFDPVKIYGAVKRCLINGIRSSSKIAEQTSEQVSQSVNNIVQRCNGSTVAVEEVQRYVIQQLWAAGHFEAAEHYQNYREKHKQNRIDTPIPPEVVERILEDQKHFPTDLQYYQFMSKFSRWRDEDNRRETWKEACFNRVLPWLFKQELVKDKLTEQEKAELSDAVFNLKASPSLRVIQMAGPALDRCNVGVYSCAYAPCSDLFFFPELLYILMQGTGEGFSCESDYVSYLPRIKKQRGGSKSLTKVPDTTEGWCDAYYAALNIWFDGDDTDFDVSEVRPAGTRLKIKGGRSSGPEPFLELMSFARNMILSKQGRYLEDSDVHRLACFTGRIVQVGGVRRSAEISLSDLDSVAMRDIKQGKWWNDATYWPDAKYLSMANNSAVYNVKPSMKQFCGEWVALINSNSGERGVFNREGVLNSKPSRRKAAKFGGNPCLTGDVLIAVADGRGSVSIKDLAEEGKDVPVYCYDSSSNLTIRWMRNPRITGESVPVYKVTFDNGFSLKATKNHKFRLRNGSYTEVEKLLPGSSLATLTGYKVDDRLRFCYCNGDVYASRLIAEFYEGRKILPDEHVHHLNKDRNNDYPDNLQLKNNIDHLSDHSFGLSNPNTTGKTNEQIIERGRELVHNLGRRFSIGEWQDFARENNLPLTFSEWRQKSLGDIITFSKRCAVLEGFDNHADADPRTIRSYYRALDAGLNAEIINGELFVHKNCERCGKSFTKSYNRREIGFCSRSCSLKDSYKNDDVKNRLKESINRAHTRNRDVLRNKQVEVYNNLKSKLNRSPMKKEWIAACKKEGVKTSMNRHCSPFYKYEDLQLAASMYNHKVVSVEFVGHENVYNGTVDDFHNFFVGGWSEQLNENGSNRVNREKTVWINNRQCGEIVLKECEFCNLSIAIARSYDNVESLKEKVRLATIFGVIQSTCTKFNYIRDVWRINCEDERLLGVDVTGHADCPLLRYRAPGRDELLRMLKGVVAETRKEFAKRFGINESAADTCIKPGGDSSVLFDCSSGISDRFSRYQIRNVREPRNTPIAKFLIDSGVPYAEAPEDKSLLAFSFPKSAPEGCTTRNDHIAIQQCEMWLETKKEWAEHSVSVTIYVDEHEWLEVGDWVYKHWDHITGLSFLPKDNGSYVHAPNEELTKEQYEEFCSKFPQLNWSKLQRYEENGITEGSQTYACVGGACDI